MAGKAQTIIINYYFIVIIIIIIITLWHSNNSTSKVLDCYWLFREQIFN